MNKRVDIACTEVVEDANTLNLGIASDIVENARDAEAVTGQQETCIAFVDVSPRDQLIVCILPQGLWQGLILEVDVLQVLLSNDIFE